MTRIKQKTILDDSNTVSMDPSQFGYQKPKANLKLQKCIVVEVAGSSGESTFWINLICLGGAIGIFVITVMFFVYAITNYGK